MQKKGNDGIILPIYHPWKMESICTKYDSSDIYNIINNAIGI